VKGLEKAKRDDSDESLPTKIQYKIGVSYQDLKLPFVAALQKSVGKSAQEDVDLTEKDAEGSVQKELDDVKGMLENVDCLAFEAVSLDDSKGRSRQRT
jgi:ABC-type sugar transport system substrate-binding protein